MINVSEGEKMKRINEAKGQASEVLALGEATAESIRKVGQAITSQGGADAVRLELGQKYIQALEQLSNGASRVRLLRPLKKFHQAEKVSSFLAAGICDAR